ncbi:tetratricopeptide repeat protein [Amycolatopsis vastitatis]|uniref:Uncharacterized protein n=1 Tax=Amycolatopsis vastitatis TaxID=1905142 RepID=A0A229SLF6_9PSEU|nr:tetratricopeptide repeat protein [Amycolatopsis vastitatis]OXM59762.1 hypothetical protein CF165_46005 [Amycolatopsis vastitatis]
MLLADCTPSQLEIRSIVGMGRANSTTLTELTAYFPRRHDDAIRKRVLRIAEGESGVLTLVGGPKSGKKRALWEAIRSSRPGMLSPLLEGWWIWPGTSPSDPQSLLEQVGELPPKAVLWLPNAGRYLFDHGSELGERVARTLRDLVYDGQRKPIMILMTLRPKDLHALNTAPAAGQPGSYIHIPQLLAGSVITVPEHFTEVEISAASASEDPRIVEAAQRSADGYLTQYLVEAPDFQARFSMASPTARAIMQCIIDARGIGHGQWMREALLENGANGYLPEWELARLSENWFEAALDELTACDAGETGMLLVRTPVDPGGSRRERLLRLNDYLECQYVTEAGHPRLPAQHLWPLLYTYAHSESLIDLGCECRRRGLFREAAEFFLRVRDGDGATARRELASMMHQAGRTDEALELYRAAARHHSDAAVLAGGKILLEAGRPEAAIEWLSQSKAPGNSESLKLMAIAYVEADQHQQAVEVYRRLAKMGDANAAVVAAEMIAEDGGYEKAVNYLAVLRKATGLNTLSGIADLLTEYVNAAEAVRWLKEHADAGDADSYLVGSVVLANLGEIEKALTWCDKAVDAGVTGATTHAAKIYAQAGLVDTALVHAQVAARCGAPVALAEVGHVHVERGLRRRAMDCFAGAATRGHDESWVLAAEQAAYLGEIADAASCYRRARAAATPAAAARIAVALCHQEMVHEALRWYIGAVDVASADVLVPLAEFLEGDAAGVVVDAYATRQCVDRGTAMQWIGEGLALIAKKNAASNASWQQRINTSKCIGQPPVGESGGAVYWFEQAACNGYPAARLRAAELLLEFDRTHEALALLKEVRSTGLLRKTDPRLLVALIREKEFDEALAVIEMEIDLGETALVGQVVTALFRAERSKDATRLLERAVAAGDVSARVILADRQARKKRYDAALRHYLVAYCHGREDVLEKIERILTVNGDFTVLEDLRRYGVTVKGEPNLPWTLEDVAGGLDVGVADMKSDYAPR